MTALTSDDLDQRPWFQRGNYAPVTEEVDAFDLEVHGSLPPELSGLYVRNGSNPKVGASHWFLGDGMLHGIRLRDGRAEWYRNRWVRTRALEGARKIDMSTGRFDYTVGVANTHIVRHAGRMFALEETSFPNEVSPELDTIGPYDFDGRLTTAMTAHPHTCAETGEMHFFGYGLVAPPYLTYHVADAAGVLVHSQEIDVAGPTMVHDFAISRNYALFLDLPVVFDLELAITGTMPFRWSDTYGARIGVLHRERARQGEQPVWFDIDPCYVFHVLNAWDDGADGHQVWLDAGRHRTMWNPTPDDFEPSYLWRWHLDLETGAVREEQLADHGHALPRIDDRRTGLAYRYGWATTDRDGRSRAGAMSMEDAAVVVKYDTRTGEATRHDFGPACVPGEPVFVPAHDAAAEDEGYLMTFVWDAAEQRSAFVVLDASDMAAEPIATVTLPQRVPHGFHGSWMAD
jgi:carotenoid cleavage dioxygenase